MRAGCAQIWGQASSTLREVCALLRARASDLKGLVACALERSTAGSLTSRCVCPERRSLTRDVPARRGIVLVLEFTDLCFESLQYEL